MKNPITLIGPAMSGLLLAAQLAGYTEDVRACPECVFGPQVFSKSGGGGPGSFNGGFLAPAGPGFVDLDSLGTPVNAIVTLNSVTVLGPHQGQPKPLHTSVPVTLLQNNNLSVALIGSGRGQLQVTVRGVCYPTLPPPQLVLQNVDYSNGGFDYYNLGVANSSVYPDALFAAAPDLPACGLNSSASRSWVDVYSGVDNTRLNGFCSLSAASQLNTIWFALPAGSVPPDSVYIKLTDRLCGTVYTSAPLALATTPCFPNLPTPQLQLLNVDAGTYNLTVQNWTDYPDALFAASPDLPPCGDNTSASRTWVDIYDASNDSYVYGFCSFSSASDLTRIWFYAPSNPPSSVYITLTDRLCNTIYKSTVLNLSTP